MKSLFLTTAMLASSIAFSAGAQTPASHAAAPAGPVKIAVISFQVAVAQTNEGQRNFADLQKKFEPKRQKLKAQSEEIDTLTKQLQTQGSALSDGERASRAKTIDEKKKVFDRDADEARGEFQSAVQDMVGTLSSKVYDVLSSYSKQEGYTLVLDEGQQQGPVLIASAGTDITKAVIAAYNTKSGVPAPPAAPATNAPKQTP
jgi:outer membrane protein